MNYGRRRVTKENIFKQVSEYEIFSYYVENFFKIGAYFRSSLRKDKNPTCVIGWYNGELRYKDFAIVGSMDCIDYVKAKYGISFLQALDTINRDFNLGLAPASNRALPKKPSKGPVLNKLSKEDMEKREKPPKFIKTEIRNWSNLDKLYWNHKYGITSQDLKKFGVYPISSFWINDKYFKSPRITYGYYLGKDEDNSRQLWKIYSPYGKKGSKWFCNTTVIQGLDQLPWTGDYLIITKSLKDVIVLSKAGFPAIAPQSESDFIDNTLMTQLKKRFKNIVLFYDNDDPGIKSSNKLSGILNIDSIIIPKAFGVKDVSDFVEKYDYFELKTLIHNLWIKDIK